MLATFYQDVLQHIFSFLTPEELSIVRETCKALNIVASSTHVMSPFLQRLRNIDKNVDVLPPPDKNPTWCYERFSREFKRIADDQAKEIAHFLFFARALPNTPAVQHELAQLRALHKKADKHKTKLTALEEAHSVLERLNAALIESKINLNSDRLDLFKMNLTRFPQSVLDKHQHYWKKLKIIECSHNKLRALPNIRICSALQGFYCYNNKLTTLPDLSNCPLLERLYCDDNELTVLPDLRNCPLLERLYCGNNKLTTLPSFSNCLALKWLYCYNNKLTVLPDLRNCPDLQKIYCGGNMLTVFPDTSNCPALEEVACYNNNLTHLPDFSNCHALKMLSFYNNYVVELSDDLINKMGKKWATDTLRYQKIFLPSFVAKVTTFSAYPRLSSFFFSTLIATALLSITGMWLTLIAGITAGAYLHTFLKLRRAFYNKTIIKQKPLLSELPYPKQDAFLAGQNAANSINCYLVSFLRKNAWRHFDIFGAGMQNELNRRINVDNKKKCTAH